MLFASQAFAMSYSALDKFLTILIYFTITLQANAIAEDVGYPSFIKDDRKLDARYSMVSEC